MPDFIPGMREVTTDWLPGNRPILARLVVTHIDVMTGSIQRNPILTETGDAMVFG
jgi:hypothetical protein